MAPTWFSRRRDQPPPLTPSAWRFGGPTSDSSSGSTSLTAAATRVTEEKVKRGNKSHDTWQEEAWAMYDQVGELRYVSNAIASRMGQARLYVEVNGKEVEYENDGDAQESDPILDLITPQMIERLGLNLFVGGAAYLAGLPLGDNEKDLVADSSLSVGTNPDSGTETVWVVLSSLEVKRSNGKVEIRGEEYKEDEVYLERIWDPHPARWEDADSPVRSALPVLRELVGLTQHVSAQIDSRLAGAGVYWIPNSILTSGKNPTSTEGQTTFSENPVLNAIMQGMLLPMEDRSNAAAVVPLLMGAPDESIAKIRFDSFATPFDKNTGALREEAIRRLGLNLDAPPELLQGMGDANHWGMWLVRDEVIQAHVSPRLDLICDALTTGFYRPILEQQGKTDPESYVVKADVSHLVQRPNRLADASQLHQVGVLSDDALREAGGFEKVDAPTSKEKAINMALQVAAANPQLLDNMPEIVAAVTALLDGTPNTGPGMLQSAREPGTLVPIRPNQALPTPAAPAAQSGQPAPISEAEGQPASGNPT